MASSVATPLEQQFAAIPALDQMTSTSGLGSMSITLQFDLSRNIDAAAGDVQTAINAATGCCPKTCPAHQPIEKPIPADRPVLIYAVHCDDHADLPGRRLRLYDPGAEDFDRERRLRGHIFGQRPYATRVQVNPGALPTRGLGFEDVRTRGRDIGQSTQGHPDRDKQTFTLDTNDQLFNAAAYKNVLVAYRNGAPVRIKDVADVIDRRAEQRTGAWYFDMPAEVLAIQRQAGSNISKWSTPSSR